MPKNTVSDPITDQEMAFAHLILSGTMNDRRAAEAVGLNPASTNWVPAAIGYVFDAVLDRGGSLRLPVSPQRGFSRRRR